MGRSSKELSRDSSLARERALFEFAVRHGRIIVRPVGTLTTGTLTSGTVVDAEGVRLGRVVVSRRGIDIVGADGNVIAALDLFGRIGAECVLEHPVHARRWSEVLRELESEPGSAAEAGPAVPGIAASFKEVADFLESTGLSQYTDAFIQNGIGPKELPTLTGDDLKEMGVVSLGHRKAILAAIQSKAPNAAAPPPAAMVPAAQDAQKVSSFLRQARDALNFKDFAGAVAKADQCIEIDPENHEAWDTKSHAIMHTFPPDKHIAGEYIAQAEIERIAPVAAAFNNAVRTSGDEKAKYAEQAAVDLTGYIEALINDNLSTIAGQRSAAAMEALGKMTAGAPKLLQSGSTHTGIPQRIIDRATNGISTKLQSARIAFEMIDGWQVYDRRSDLLEKTIALLATISPPAPPSSVMLENYRRRFRERFPEQAAKRERESQETERQLAVQKQANAAQLQNALVVAGKVFGAVALVFIPLLMLSDSYKGNFFQAVFGAMCSSICLSPFVTAGILAYQAIRPKPHTGKHSGYDYLGGR